VGWVHGVPVSSEELDRYVEQLAAGLAGARIGIADGALRLGGPRPSPMSREGALREWAAKALLVDRLLQVEAARLGVVELTSPDEWLARLEAAGELDDLVPTETELLDYHAANRHLFRVNEARRVRHIVVRDREQAQRMREAVLAAGRDGAKGDGAKGDGAKGDGAALALLAAGSSLDEGSRRQGGDLGWVERGHLAGPLEEAIFMALPGHLAGPVASVFGWHLIVVEAVRPARDRPYAECRSEVRAEILEHRRRRSALAWTDRRIVEAVRAPEGAEHPAFRGLPGSMHRH